MGQRSLYREPSQMLADVALKRIITITGGGESEGGKKKNKGQDEISDIGNRSI